MLRFLGSSSKLLPCGVANAIRSGENVVPVVIAALDRSATVGEIATMMRRAVDMAPDAFDSPLP